MSKFNADHVVITTDDIDALEAKGELGVGVTIQELPDGLHVRLVDMAKAKQLAKEHGGLPC